MFKLIRILILVSSVHGYSRLLPMWWNIGGISRYCTNKPNKIIFNSDPLVLYKDKDWIIHSDICPHRGASLAKGKIKNSCIQCPYHGWEFKEGNVVNIPGLTSKHIDTISEKNKLNLVKYKNKIINNDIYISAVEEPLEYIYEAPEEYDTEYDKIGESLVINRPYQMVTENIIDMSHISYVHSFGNNIKPDPYDIKYEKINDYSGRTIFRYTSGDSSLSKLLGGADSIKVCNEFHLPSTTVTKVNANGLIKIIVTSAYPIDDSTTMLSYNLYRNYLTDNILMDLFHYWRMKVTLKEDIDILSNVYESYFMGKFDTKFDITQKRYREACNLVLNKFII